MIPILGCVFVESPDAQAVIHLAIQLMGGVPLMRKVTTVEEKGIATLGLNEQSERYTGPVLTNVIDYNSHLDFRALSFGCDFSIRGAQVQDWTKGHQAADFHSPNSVRPGFAFSPLDMRDELLLNPIRVLLWANANVEARLLPAVREGVENYERVSMRYGGSEVILWFRKSPGNLDRVEEVGPRDMFWSAWRETRKITRFANWQTVTGGLCYPFFSDETRNGVKFAEWSVTEARVHQGQGQLDIKPRVPTSKLPSLKLMAPGLWQYPGGFPCEVLEDDKSLLILDAPNCQEFCEAIALDLKARFPAKKVVGVVLTDPYWPHQCGFLSFVRRGIQVFTESRNIAFLKELTSSWQLRAKFNPIGIDATRQVVSWRVTPLLGVASERFLNVYSSKSKILFCSDTVSWKSKDELYNPAAAIDVRRMIERENLDVASVLATHSALMPWAKVLGALPP